MKRLMTGNQAIARGAFEAGVTVASAYPGTPSTEIIETMATYPEIYAEWSTNEKVALEVGIGASIGGARALVAMKHVGVNVAADPLFTFSYTGVNGGLVLVSADDPGMHSSQNEQDNRNYAKFAKIPVLEPSDSQECKDFVLLAFQLSEQFDTPVMVRTTTRVAHGQSLVTLGERQEGLLKDYEKNPPKYVMLPGYGRQRHPVVEDRRKAMAAYNETAPVNRIEWGDKRIGVITSGVVYQYVKEALPEASVLKLGMTFPLPQQLIKDFAGQVEKLYVIEELEPFLEEQIRAWGIEVVGKELFPRIGELSPELIGAKLGDWQQEAAVAAEVPNRPPVLCPGCPHRGVYYVINRLKLTVSGDIGCYTLGATPPLSAMDTCICMGASISGALGLEKARGKEFARKLVAVIGDSTFLHSGITGLLDVVYNGGTFTTLILDNSTTAMTGHQEHPGTGCRVDHTPAPAVDLEQLVRSLGVKRVRTVDPYDLAEVERVLKEETAAEEASVVIAKRPCVLLKGHQPTGGPVRVDESLCTECGRCRRLGCPALVFKTAKPSVDSTLCNGCGQCVQVCRFNALVKEGEAND